MLAIQKHLRLAGGNAMFKAADSLKGLVFNNAECSCVLGGVLAIGLACGRDDWDSILGQHKDRPGWNPATDVKVRAVRFTTEFKKRFGSLSCPDLQKMLCGKSYDMTIPDEAKAFSMPEIHYVCADLVGATARMATEIILDLEFTSKPIEVPLHDYQSLV